MVLSASAAGCSSSVQDIGRLAFAEGAIHSDATVAFESIDGPPPTVFRKLVDALNEQATARRIKVVPRAEPATYRVRGYVSALVEGGKTSFGWVWDVYDADRHRTLRISGREPGAGRHRDAWSAADAAVLRRIAGDGMARIAAFLEAPEPTAAAKPRAVTLASAGAAHR
jgi:hypothetical protein